MATSPVQTLIGAVRRRSWRWQFVAAVRLASWGSAALMLFAVTVHLAVRPVSAGAVLWALAALWAAMLAWAGWRRPSDAACALWADRHLGGASAFTTLLELGKSTPGTAHAQAARWLEQWATARVPDSLRLLAQQPAAASARLSRPLLSMLVCTALAALVLMLPGLAPAPVRQGAASSASGSPERGLSVAGAPAAAELVNEVAGALRSAPPRDAPERREGGRAPAAGAGQTDAGQGPATSSAGATPASERGAATDATAGTTADAAPKAGTSQVSGAGAGREAGDSRDDRSGVGVSRVLRGTMSVQRSELVRGRASSERQADMDRLAAYDEASSMHGAAVSLPQPAAAAAVPPAATEFTRLTPTETSYVQAWLKASASRR